MTFSFENLRPKNRPWTFMAPMEGITDVPFRKIARDFGCDVICTQMIHAEGLLRGTYDRMPRVMEMRSEEKPIGFQLCGEKPTVVAEAAQRVEEKGAAFIDLNMGCPAKNIVKRGAGAALMKDPLLAATIVEQTVAKVKIPVTIKIRAGWDDATQSAAELSKRCEQAGAAAVSIHARTRSQGHKGKPDWSLISDLKKVLHVPVIGNGGVFQPSHVEEMLSFGADGIMLARGALGNPWLFQARVPQVREIEEVLLKHFDTHLDYYGNTEKAVMTFRKHIVWYTKGLRNSSSFRAEAFKTKDPDEARKILGEFFQTLDPTETPHRERDC